MIASLLLLSRLFLGLVCAAVCAILVGACVMGSRSTTRTRYQPRDFRTPPLTDAEAERAWTAIVSPERES